MRELGPIIFFYSHLLYNCVTGRKKNKGSRVKFERNVRKYCDSRPTAPCDLFPGRPQRKSNPIKILTQLRMAVVVKVDTLLQVPALLSEKRIRASCKSSARGHFLGRKNWIEHQATVDVRVPTNIVLYFYQNFTSEMPPESIVKLMKIIKTDLFHKREFRWLTYFQFNCF